MLILGIETSCDETAAAIVKDGRKILSNVVASSSHLHQKTGGIIPEVAAREQVKCIIPVIEEAIKRSSYRAIKRSSYRQTKKTSFITRSLDRFLTHIDAIAVTIGPGLIGSLLVGIETAKTIAFVTGKPIVPVNHIFAHIYANWMLKTPTFPLLALVVSGGHTELFLMKDHGKISWIGGTRDDAAGEAFDKTARLLSLGFPGGPAIAAEAAKFKVKSSKLKVQMKLPRPMIHEDNLDFSFSGLKTAVLRKVKKLKTMEQWNNRTMRYMAFEIQEAITDCLVDKTIKAAEKYKAKSILLGGGVAANCRLKEKFQLAISNQQLTISLHVPPPHLCTDNAVYIASCAYFNYKPVPWKKIQAQPSLSVEV